MSAKTLLSRRTMLRSLTTGVGVAVGLPIFDAMLNDHGNAFAADGASLPIRYGTFFWGNGVRPDRWVPKKTGAQWWEDPNEELVSIAHTPEVRGRVNVLSGFRLVSIQGTAHHMPRGQVLTGTYVPSPDGACCGSVAGPSADWLVRQAWAGRSLLRDAVDVGISQSNKGSGFSINSGTVFDDNGSAHPLEMSPRAVFDSLFGNGLPEGVPQVDLSAYQNSRYAMVDLVREDAARLRARLGKNDQQRIDAHLEQLLEVERSIDALESASSCMVPLDYPEPADFYRQEVMITQDGQPATIMGELLTEKNEVMANLIALALACDLTRVFAYQHHGMQTDTVFWNLPSVSLGHHQSTHDDRGNSPNPEAQDLEAVHEISEYVMSQFNVLLKALASMPEGAGDVLDNCAIYAVSEYGDASAHSSQNLSILTAGRAGGALVSGYHFDGAGRNVQDVPLALMQAVGLEIDGFGQGNLRSTTAFDPLLA